MLNYQVQEKEERDSKRNPLIDFFMRLPIALLGLLIFLVVFFAYSKMLKTGASLPSLGIGRSSSGISYHYGQRQHGSAEAEAKYRLQAESAYQRKDYQTAATSYEKAIVENNTIPWNTQVEARKLQATTCSLCKALANVYHQSGDQFKECEALLSASFAATISNPPDSEVLAKQALDLAQKLGNSNELAKANEAYASCTRTLHGRNDSSQSPMLEQTLQIRKAQFKSDAYSDWHLYQKNFNQATEMYVSDLDSLARHYEYDLHQYDKSALLFQQLLDLNRSALGAENPATLGAMRSVAMNLWRQKKTAESVTLLEQILELDRKILGRDHTMYVQDLSLLANSYMDEGKFAEIEKIRQEQLEIVSRTDGASSASAAGILEALARVLAMEGKSSEAAPYAQRAVEIRQSTHTGQFRGINGRR